MAMRRCGHCLPVRGGRAVYRLVRWVRVQGAELYSYNNLHGIHLQLRFVPFRLYVLALCLTWPQECEWLSQFRPARYTQSLPASQPPEPCESVARIATCSICILPHRPRVSQWSVTTTHQRESSFGLDRLAGMHFVDGLVGSGATNRGIEIEVVRLRGIEDVVTLQDNSRVHKKRVKDGTVTDSQVGDTAV